MTAADDAAARLRALPPNARLIAAERERQAAEVAEAERRLAETRETARYDVATQAQDLDESRARASLLTVNGALTDAEVEWARMVERLAQAAHDAATVLRAMLEAR